MAYRFNDAELLSLALTHRSYCAEHESVESNERLEFLGDAVLGLAVTDHIYSEYDDLAEGQLAKLRASVVNTVTLAALAEQLELGGYLWLGKGEDRSGGRNKESILADAIEAVFGAIYVDGGWLAAQQSIVGLLSDKMREASDQPGRLDYKTQLQELTARMALGAPAYEITESGPDHDKVFSAVTIVNGVARGEGAGSSKKRAEQVAARSAYKAVKSLAEKVDRQNDSP